MSGNFILFSVLYVIEIIYNIHLYEHEKNETNHWNSLDNYITNERYIICTQYHTLKNTNIKWNNIYYSIKSQ